MAERFFSFKHKIYSGVVFISILFSSITLYGSQLEDSYLRCSATFSKTEFGAGLFKHLEQDGTLSIKDRNQNIILEGCLRAEVLSWEARVIGFRLQDGSDGLISFDGTRLIDGMDDIYLVDEQKRILGLKKYGRYGVMIFSDSFVKRKIKEKQSSKSKIILRINEDKNLTTDQSNLRELSSVRDEDFWGSGLDISTYEEDMIGRIPVTYKTVQFYSKGKLYDIEQLNLSDINVELILVQNEKGDWGVFDGYGNEVLPISFEADKVQIINKSSLIVSKADKEYNATIRDDYSTIDLDGRVERIEFR